MATPPAVSVPATETRTLTPAADKLDLEATVKCAEERIKAVHAKVA